MTFVFNTDTEITGNFHDHTTYQASFVDASIHFKLHQALSDSLCQFSSLAIQWAIIGDFNIVLSAHVH